MSDAPIPIDMPIIKAMVDSISHIKPAFDHLTIRKRSFLLDPQNGGWVLVSDGILLLALRTGYEGPRQAIPLETVKEACKAGHKNGSLTFTGDKVYCIGPDSQVGSSFELNPVDDNWPPVWLTTHVPEKLLEARLIPFTNLTVLARADKFACAITGGNAVPWKIGFSRKLEAHKPGAMMAVWALPDLSAVALVMGVLFDAPTDEVWLCDWPKGKVVTEPVNAVLDIRPVPSEPAEEEPPAKTPAPKTPVIAKPSESEKAA